jgi:hypothetical protein
MEIKPQTKLVGEEIRSTKQNLDIELMISM